MSDSNVAPLRAEDVLRDVGYPAFVAGLFNRSHEPRVDFTHAILGVATEITELLFADDEVNSLEELGDLRFYGQATLNLVEEFTGDDFPYELVGQEITKLVNVGNIEGVEDAIDKARTELLDICKRWIGYGKEPSDLALAGAKTLALVLYTSDHCRYPEPDVDRIELANVAKLLDRYKSLQFSAERAVNRDAASERRVLEAS